MYEEVLYSSVLSKKQWQVFEKRVTGMVELGKRRRCKIDGMVRMVRAKSFSEFDDFVCLLNHLRQSGGELNHDPVVANCHHRF